jgi:hypothetical protein
MVDASVTMNSFALLQGGVNLDVLDTKKALKRGSVADKMDRSAEYRKTSQKSVASSGGASQNSCMNGSRDFFLILYIFTDPKVPSGCLLIR